MNNRYISLIALILLTFIPQAQAHPGAWAPDGCHYCRTNCDGWGEEWNVRHCHGQYKSQ